MSGVAVSTQLETDRTSTAAPLHGLLEAALRDPMLADVVARADRPSGRITGPIGLRPFVAGALAAPRSVGGAGARVCLVTATGREAESAAAAIGDLIGDEHVDGLPVLGDPAARTALAAADTVGRRVSVLAAAGASRRASGRTPAVSSSPPSAR